MAYSNGNLPASALSPIAGGQLANEAAAAWNAMNEEARRRYGVELRPTGSQSSYRDIDGQWYFWNLYQSGRGNLAAYPGTSNHGLGRAVDLATPQMRAIVDEIGAKYGWRKVEAPSEWWHVNYVGGYDGKNPGPDGGPPPKPDWWKDTKRKLNAARATIKSKKHRRKQTDSKKRKSILHRQIERLKNFRDWAVKRMKNWNRKH